MNEGSPSAGRGTVPIVESDPDAARPVDSLERSRRATRESSRTTRRPLQIFAYDPMLGRVAGNRIGIDIAYERLEPGPVGSKIEIIDYDSTLDTFYPPVDLDSPSVLMCGGLDPSEGDPHFHQQMTYAVVMKVIENFERGLGREIRFRKNRRLKVFPHAFRSPNAFYDFETRSLFFGYFRADDASPGHNRPRQWVFTCLSHDIVAHETAHAVIDKLRYRYRYPTNPDVLALHEAVADIVAIFQHFTFPEVLRESIRTTRADIRSASPLIQLAVQFGHGTGRGSALRSTRDGDAPDPTLYRTAFEPHERGSILVAAVFDAFFKLYRARIEDLLRLATGGTGQLPEGALHPDLVNRAADEAAAAAGEMLTVCLRAFDYMPVLDPDFGDFLRAIITADHELNPVDRHERRAALIESFRARGIHPHGVSSLGEDALLWEPVPKGMLPPLPDEIGSFVLREIVALDRDSDASPEDMGDLGFGSRSAATTKNARKNDVYRSLRRYGWSNRTALGLEGNNLSVVGFNPTFRVGDDGKLRTEVVVQFLDETDPSDEYGGITRGAGATVVFAADGRARYVITTPWPHDGLPDGLEGAARFRRDRTREFVAACDARIPDGPWASDDYWGARMERRFSFASLHRAVGFG